MADEDGGIWTRAFNAAHTEAGVGGVVFYSYGTYTVDDVILLHNSQTAYSMGLGTVTITQTGNAPIFASKNFYDDTGPTGRTKITGFRLIGDITKPLNHGILLRDYYSTISDCRVIGVGGDCYHLTTRNQNGSETGGTLVDNRLVNCDAFRPVGHCFWIGEANNNKLTDGYMDNCYMSSSITTPKHLYIGSSAGWIINTIHTYGEATQVSLEVLNAISTKLDNIYIEHFIDRGISLGSVQRDVQLSNVTIRCDDAKLDGLGQAIYISKSAAVTSAQVSVSNLTLRQNTDKAVDGINSASSALDISVVNYKLEQNFSNKIKRRSGVGMDNIKMVTNALVEGSLRETSDKSSLLYEGRAHALASTVRLNGSGAKTANIPLSPISNGRKIIGTLNIGASAFDNGVKRAAYMAQVMISAKTNGTNPWVVYVTDIVTPTGFKVNPSITVTNTNEIGELIVNFEYANADSQGIVSFIYSPATTTKQ
jgi:hypothetical protein